jgi:arginine/lysine/ornithine decarboxylase
MCSPETNFSHLESVLAAIPSRPALSTAQPHFNRPKQMLSIRKAALSPYEVLPISQCNGRILAAATVGCPPAVPILVCGERIDKDAITAFQSYQISTCCVVIE